MSKAENKKDTDCFKKATTDGVTKCLSFLGFNAEAKPLHELASYF